MTRRPASLQCGLAGLALLLVATQPGADEGMRDAVRRQFGNDSYVLVEDHGESRLYVLTSDAEVTSVAASRAMAPTPRDEALAMTRNADAGTRVRALTLLAADTSAAVRDAAFTLLNDPDEAVREEAYLLLLEHPDSDRPAIAALARMDDSTRVRESVAELLSEQAQD